MRNWLRSFGYVCTFFLVVFLAVPVLTGFLAESKCKQIVAAINSAAPFTITITKYERGWFNSGAEAQLVLNKVFDVKNPQLSQIPVILHISHGPVIIDWKRIQFAEAIINADFNLNEAQNTLLKRATDAGAVATAKIKVKISGKTDIDFSSKPFAYQDETSKLYWRGFNISTKLSPFFNQMQSTIDVSGVDISFKNSTFHLDGLSGFYKGNKTDDGLWLGERSLKVKSFSMVGEDKHPIAVDDFNLTCFVGDNKNIVNTAIAINVGNFSVNDDKYKENNVDLEINGLDHETLAELQKQMQAMHDAEGASVKQAKTGFDLLLALLSSGGELNIKQFNMTTPWGKLMTMVNISFAKQPNSNILAIATNSVINTDIKMDRGVALYLFERFYKATQTAKQAITPEKQAENLLNEWMKSGKIIQDKDAFFHIIFAYKDKQLLLNNKPMTLTFKP